MYKFIELVRNFYGAVFNVLDTYLFEFDGMSVSIMDILLGFIIVAIVISVFWKGARA